MSGLTKRSRQLRCLVTDPVLTAACFAALVVAMGYGSIVPAIPPLLERLLPYSHRAMLPLHTGGLTGVYMVAIFLFAPLWGHFSDRFGHRLFASVALIGYALAFVSFLFVTDLRVAYVTRILAGAFAAGIGPTIRALIAQSSDRDSAIGRFAVLGAITLAGALLGPILASWIIAMVRTMPEARASSLMVGLPVYVTALLAIASAGVLHRASRTLQSSAYAGREAPAGANSARSSPLFALATLNMLVAFGLGSLEVAVALRIERSLALDARLTAALLMLCSLVMIATQAWFFLAPSRRRGQPHAVGLAAFVLMALGFALLPVTAKPLSTALIVGLIGGAAGAAQLAIAVATAARRDEGLGRAFGMELAFAALGQGLGSLTAGAAFQWNDSLAFFVATAFMAAGAVVAFRLGSRRWRLHRHHHWDSHV